MAYYDKFVDSPEELQRELAERRGMSREQLDERADRILATVLSSASAAKGPHLTLSEATQYFEEGSAELRDATRAHVDACTHCQALLEGLQPQNVNRAVEVAWPSGREGQEGLEHGLAELVAPAGQAERPTTRSRGAQILTALQSVAACALIVGALIWAGILKPVSPTSSMVSDSDFAQAAVAFEQGNPGQAYDILRQALAQSGVKPDTLNALAMMTVNSSHPIRPGDGETIARELFEGGRPIDTNKIATAAQANRVMQFLVQIGDHPRALQVLSKYLEFTEASSTALANWRDNLPQLALSALSL